MDPKQRITLKNNCDVLAKTIDINKLKPLLLKFKVFTKAMLEDIENVSDLMHEIPSRGPKAFKCFIKILEIAGYTIEADALKDDVSERMITIEVDASERRLMPSSLPRREEFYEISSRSAGYCLIINNVDFKPHYLDERVGSDKDAAALRNIFEEMGYDVKLKKNLCAEDMCNTLKEFSSQNFNVVDSCIVIILSHGRNINNLDILYGVDGKYISKKDVIYLFNNRKCKCLINKPKIFIFVACRGKEKDYGVCIGESVDSVVIKDQADSLSFKNYSVPPRESSDAYAFDVQYPMYSDIYIIHSTLPYNISIREHEKGSWLCQDLIEVLSEDCTLDLNTVVTYVNSKMIKRISQEFRVKQAVHKEDWTCSKSIRFPSRKVI